MPHGRCRNVFPLDCILHKRRDSHRRRSQQEATDIEAAASPELHVPLLDPGSLVAKPHVTLACGSGGGIVGHSGLR
jgi:hypothetical protein